MAADLAAPQKYRRVQALLAARMAQQVLRVWRDLMNPAKVDASWPAVRAALMPIVQQARDQSAVLARAAYVEARQDAGMPDDGFSPSGPLQLAIDRLESTLDVTGPVEFKKAIAAGRTPQQAMDAAAVRMVGSTQYLALEGGRSVMKQSTDADERATGWSRVTDGDPCAWCAMLASRGPVYKTAKTAGDPRQGGDRYHDHCVPAGTLVDGPAAEVGYRRHYEGEMILVHTAAGHELRITPNHPVLTDQGWVPAGLLRVGDRVVSSFNAQGRLLQVPDEEQVPARVEDVWGALGVLGLVRVPGSTEDFHGDGADGEVDVVRADGLLRREADAEAGELVAELELALAGVGESSLAVLGSQFEFLGGGRAPAGCLMGGSGHLGALLGSCLRHVQDARLFDAADLYPGFIEVAPNDQARHAVALGERGLAFAFEVGARDLLNGEGPAVAPSRGPATLEGARDDAPGNSGFGFDLLKGLAGSVEGHGGVDLFGGRRVRRFDPGSLGGSVDGHDSYARLGLDLLESLAGRVELDSIVDLRRAEFSGHVYNFQTAEGWYRADGLIVSNCACQAWPAFTLDEPFIGIAEGLYDDWLRVTRGRGGKHAVNAFRRWWEAEGRAAYAAPDRPAS